MRHHNINRRQFGFGAVALAGAGLLAVQARAQDVAKHSVTTSLGTYDIPDDPQRVVCIDSRLDLEPAIALGLNVIAHAYGTPEPWVPVKGEMAFVGEVPDLEKVLALDPDLIICTDVGDPDAEYWPIGRLKDIAPVLPPAYIKPWKVILAELGAWTGRSGAADGVLADYDALIADIKQRHAGTIGSKTIVVIQPSNDGTVNLQAAMSLLQPQVMADLGVKTLPAVEGNVVSAENFTSLFGEVDGILYVNHGEGIVEFIEQEPLWSRLPAVAAGNVLSPLGNTNFGGVYTATQIAHFLDELLTKIA